MLVWMSMVRQQHFNDYRRNIGLFIVALPLVIGWCLLLLAGMYAQPLALTHDVGSRFETMRGLYAPERNQQFSYAYTSGDALLRLPQIGVGRFIVALRMGGPGASVALPAQLIANEQLVDLGQVQQIRTYHMLVPADTQGTVQLQLLSPRVTIAGDSRSLGVLLDRVEIRSVGPVRPPVAIVLSVVLVLSLATAEVIRRAMPLRRKVGLLLLVSTILAILYGVGRGTIDLATWWNIFILSIFGAVILQLSQLDGRGFARPIYAVATLFIAWRAALWFLAALGLHYRAVLMPLTALIEHDDSSAAPSAFAANVLAGSWVHWDSTAYLAIAERGYAFFGQRWPTIAFFPLYPLLTRATAFVTGQSAASAALLIAQIAFFAALLLLYSLLAHDFGDTLAYRSVLLLLVCPTSFFFAAAYSEALALLLLVAAVWALRREHWWLAGMAGFLLALTRLPGVLIAPILALAYLRACGWNWRAIHRPILAVLLPPAGLALFMLFQWWRFGTPFAFMIAQRNWHNYLSPPWVLPQALFGHTFVYGHWPTAGFQSLFWLGFLVLTIGALRRLPPLYSLTLLLFLLPAYLSSWPWSVSRHVLLGFPAFCMLALWTERLWVRQVLIVALLVLLVVATMLFVNGFLVA